MLLLNGKKRGGRQDILVIMRGKKRTYSKKTRNYLCKKDSNSLYQVMEKIGLKGCHK